MQFRKQGHRVQVLAYRGYDKEKKRAQVKLVGSFSPYSLDMSGELMESLTDDEKSELQSHISTIRQSHDSTMRLHKARTVASEIAGVADSLEDPACSALVTRESATATYDAIDALTKRLRKLGFRRLANPEITVAVE